MDERWWDEDEDSDGTIDPGEAALAADLERIRLERNAWRTAARALARLADTGLEYGREVAQLRTLASGNTATARQIEAAARSLKS